MLEHVIDRLLPGPSKGVETGIDDQPRSPQRLGRQHAEAIEVRRVQLHLVSQPLAVESPPFGVAAIADVAAD